MGAVLVTGASRGIGLAIALAFADAGMDLIITCSKSEEQLRLAKEMIEKRNVRCLALVSDIASSKETQALFHNIEAFTDTLSVVVNNAGISHIGLLQEMTDEQWDHIVQTNLTGLFYSSRAAIPLFLKHKKGVFINISSIWGESGASCEVAYSATKGAINSFTKALAKELAPSGIRVNAVACGVIDTEMNQWLDKDEKTVLSQDIALGRLGSTAEIAHAVVYLASENASYITGQVLTVDGGFL